MTGPGRTVIFLDFDGVLNGLGNFLDTPCVDVFGRMLEMAPAAEVVVSSTWRLWRPVADLAAMLRQFGLNVVFTGATPVAHSQKMAAHTAIFGSGLKVLDHEWARYAEIREWMTRSGVGVGDVVIVLDDLLMKKPLQPHAVKTNPLLGLLPGDLERFRRLLTRPLTSLPSHPEFRWDWLDSPPVEEWMGRFRLGERRRMDDYAARAGWPLETIGAEGPWPPP